MSYLVVLIVDNPDDYPSILSAWEELGISGVTILESTGLGRFEKGGIGRRFSIDAQPGRLPGCS